MKKIALMSLVASSVLMAGGWKIPEVSTNAVALGAANVAHNKDGADAAYYNPAKMVFMSDKNHMEADLTYIGLDAVNYEGTVGGTATDESAEKENFLIPSLHYVSGKFTDSNARIGVSIVAPAGLSKRWEGTQGIKSAEEFTLEVLEVNPTAAFKISDKLGVAVGFRMLSSTGIVKVTPATGVASQDMTGDSLDFGYNLALAYNPIQALEIGVTYRSQVNLSVDGTADLEHPGLVNGNYDVSVNIPVPATFTAAVAYTLPSKTTLELVYEKTYWSAYSNLDFDYTNPTAEAIFGNSKEKNWEDTNTFRVGLTQVIGDFDVMAGFVYDESPIPDKTLGFELPGSDSIAVSLGGNYRINKSWELYIAGLYSMHKTREVTAADSNDNGLVGEFTNADVLILSTGFGYKF